jgi:hypothetical protein
MSHHDLGTADDAFCPFYYAEVCDGFVMMQLLNRLTSAGGGSQRMVVLSAVYHWLLRRVFRFLHHWLLFKYVFVNYLSFKKNQNEN